jgi:hypothetical protein
LGFPEASGGYDDHSLGTFNDFIAEDVVGIYRQVVGDVVEIGQCSSGYPLLGRLLIKVICAGADAYV